MLGSVLDRAGNVARCMGRVKTVSTGEMDTKLNRCLTTTDITLLGIGHMFGAGIYVLTGTVAKNTAGPAIILSFLIAAFASFLAALCYAEFGARVPKAGSAYVYTYVTIGEFWAFVIGWNIILEYMIGAASVARAWSGYVDSLFEGAISNSTMATFGTMHNPYMAHYIDPLAFTVTIIYCLMLSVGVKCSAHLNSAFTIINMIVAAFVICFGLYWADLKNWQGPGGFSPYGMSGVIAGAASCFYAFVGFDSIATSSEEAKEPAKSIPIATMVSMGVVSLAYIMVGATLTLMVPYNEIHPASALPDAFEANNVVWAKYIVSIGALCGMTTTLFGALFSLPRCVYAMASDGLLFSWLANISEKNKLPVLNMVICGIFSAIIALLFDMEKLVEFMSIGTIMAYTIVSASVIILRYQPAHRCNIKSDSSAEHGEVPLSPTTPRPLDEGQQSLEDRYGGDLRPQCRWVSLIVGKHEPGMVVTWTVVMFTIVSGALCLLVQYGMGDVKIVTALRNETIREESLIIVQTQRVWVETATESTQAWAIILAIFFSALLVTGVLLICAHQQNNIRLTFTVPLVPLVPLASIFANVALVVHLDPLTWVRFGVWMVFGLLLYFLYGIHHSREREPVSSYTTLLPPGKVTSPSGEEVPTTTAAVVSAMQTTLTRVGHKVSSLRGSKAKEPAEDGPILEDTDEQKANM